MPRDDRACPIRAGDGTSLLFRDHGVGWVQCSDWVHGGWPGVHVCRRDDNDVLGGPGEQSGERSNRRLLLLDTNSETKIWCQESGTKIQVQDDGMAEMIKRNGKKNQSGPRR